MIAIPRAAAYIPKVSKMGNGTYMTFYCPRVQAKAPQHHSICRGQPIRHGHRPHKLGTSTCHYGVRSNRDMRYVQLTIDSNI